MSTIIPGDWQFYSALVHELAPEVRRVSPFPGEDCVQLLGLNNSHCRLHFSHAPVVSKNVVLIEARLSVVAKQPQLVCEVLVVCGDETSLTGGYVFRGSEAEHGGVPESSDGSPSVTRPVSLGSVLDKGKARVSSDGRKFGHVGWLTAVVNCEDCPRS